jgi:hypothetical protein
MRLMPGTCMARGLVPLAVGRDTLHMLQSGPRPDCSGLVIGMYEMAAQRRRAQELETRK